MEKAMEPHSSPLAWKIPWMEEPGRLQSMGSLRVGHDWATSLSLFTFMNWRRKGQPTPAFLPGESQGQGSLVRGRLWGLHRVGHNWSDLAAMTFHNLCASFHEGLPYFIMVIPIYFIFWILFKMVLKFIFLFYLLEYKNAIWFLHLVDLFNSINLNKLSVLFLVFLWRQSCHP